MLLFPWRSALREPAAGAPLSVRRSPRPAAFAGPRFARQFKQIGTEKQDPPADPPDEAGGRNRPPSACGTNRRWRRGRAVGLSRR